MVDVYINERSVDGQYCNDFETRLVTVINNVRTLQEQVLGGVNVHVAKILYERIICDVRQENFSTFLSRNNERKKQFQLMMQKAKLEDIPFNNCDIYNYGDIDVDNSSMEVAYIRKVPGGNYQLLLNFGDIPFPEGDLLIEKNFADGKNIYAIYDSNYIGYWLSREGILGVYDKNATAKALDEQTILANTNLFSPTNHYVQNRRVYKRIGTPEYWYVDNLHYGESVHLEVYQSSDMHFKGTCHIDDINTFKLASKKKRRERTISFD